MGAAAAEQPAFVSRTRVGVVTRLAPRGDIGRATELTALTDAVSACIADHQVKLVLDLSSVPIVSSLTLETCLQTQDKLLPMGGWLKISNANPLVRDVLRITGISQHVAVLQPDDAGVISGQVTTPVAPKQRLGDILVARGLLDTGKVEAALAIQKQSGRQLAQIIIENQWVSESEVLGALAEQLAVPFVNLRPGVFDPDMANLLPRETARRLKVLPLFKVRGELTLATAQPQAMPSLREVEEALDCRVRPVLARQEDILKLINESTSLGQLPDDLITDVGDDFQVLESSIPDDYDTIDEMASGSPVINLVNSLIHRAVRDGASDIHIEPFRHVSRVRFRIDGILYEVMTPRIELHPAIVSRLKVMANLDIAERRLPQDGRVQVHTQGRAVDLRFSSLPSLFGEKVVLRVLDKNQAIFDLDKLGMGTRNLATYKALLGRGYGLILVTGPTGSGKTTSLYAALNYLNSLEKSIVTIEDPVEYQIEVVNQNEVRDRIGLTFAMMLKHVLRQDPDIVMVGEIRERETAEIAVQAALTGHLVLSTLHTNDSVGAITRMIDMGVEPYLLSSALIGVIAQRLVRTVCPSCKTTYVADKDMVTRFGWSDERSIRLARGRGCNECYDSGFKGRLGIHEALTVDTELQRMIVSNPGKDALMAYVQERDIPMLFDDGLERVLQQQTTIEEISRVISVHGG